MLERLRNTFKKLIRFVKTNKALSLFTLMLLVGGLSAYSKYSLQNHNVVTYQEYVTDVNSGKVDEVEFDQITKHVEYFVEGVLKRSVIVNIEEVTSRTSKDILVKPLIDKKVSLLSEFLWVFVKAMLFTLIGMFMLDVLNKNEGKDVIEKKPDLTFDDVVGCDVAKSEFREIIDQFKNREKFSELGISPPKGVMLSGPPGCGKTLLARAAAAECDTNFIEVSGAEFNEVFFGMGSVRIRALFAKARKKAPCIIYFDEAESILGARSFSDSSANKSNNQTLNQILTELDGFKPSSGVMIIASTNHPEQLDKAVTRAGRIDQNISVDLPEACGREQLLNYYLKDLKLADNVDTHQLSFSLYGMTGADICNLVRQANLWAFKTDSVITQGCLQVARDRSLMGQKKNVKILEKERILIAYHEAGHALIAKKFLPHLIVDTVTIAPRGNAGGYTMLMPSDNRKFTTKEDLLNEIVMLMGGRAAENVIYGENMITTGSGNDLKIASGLARDYLFKYGFGEKFYDHPDFESLAVTKGPINGVTKECDMLLQDAYQKAKVYLTCNFAVLEKLKSMLLEQETVSTNQLESIFEY